MEFMRKALIFINWEDLEPTEENLELKQGFYEHLANGYWEIIASEGELENDEIIPRVGRDLDAYHTYIEDYIKDIQTMIKYLEDNKVPYSTAPVPFRDNYEGAGILTIKDNNIIIINVNVDNKIKEQYCPIGKAKKDIINNILLYYLNFNVHIENKVSQILSYLTYSQNIYDGTLIFHDNVQPLFW
jgi:hypothetical protein